MTTTGLKNSLIRRIKKFPKKKLKKIEGFIASLEGEGDEEATKEIMAIPGILEELKKAEESFKKGKFVRWKDIRKDV